MAATAVTGNAIVTGAASGLGRAIAVELGRRGWRVALADINSEGSHHTLSLVEQAGGWGQVERLDVTSVQDWTALRDKLQNLWGQLDLLVNNAGVGVGGEVGQLPLEDWQWIININLYGAIYGCHTLIGWLKRNPRGGHIVNIASLAAIASAPGMAPYNITKAGMVSLSETLYGELKPHKIGVTAVCPAFFATDIVRNGRFQSTVQRRMAEHLMGSSTATADGVAKRIVRAIRRKQLYVFVPAASSMLWRIKRLMPVALLNLIARRGAREAAAMRSD
jgi:NAD(P)-dependent dehydrogenase (short-subunit alcohol dehydrogenase family)